MSGSLRYYVNVNESRKKEWLKITFTFTCDVHESLGADGFPSRPRTRGDSRPYPQCKAEA